MIIPFKSVLIWVFHLRLLLHFYIHYICIFPISIFGCQILKGTSSFNHSWPKCFGTKAAQQVFIVTLWTEAHQAPLSIRFFRKNTGVGCHVLPYESWSTFQGPVTIQWSLEVDTEWFQHMWWQVHHLQLEPPVKELSSQEERANTQRQDLGPHNSALKKEKGCDGTVCCPSTVHN